MKNPASIGLLSTLLILQASPLLAQGGFWQTLGQGSVSGPQNLQPRGGLATMNSAPGLNATNGGQVVVGSLGQNMPTIQEVQGTQRAAVPASAGPVTRPVAHGHASRWDPGKKAVVISDRRGTSPFPLDGKPVSNVGNGMVYRATADSVTMQYAAASGATYYINYSPLVVATKLQNQLGKELKAGARLGTVKGGQLRLQAFAYGASGSYEYRPFNVPGVQFAAGVAPGQGEKDF